MADSAPRYCSNCGKPLAPDSKFCSACGASVSASSAPEDGARKEKWAGEVHKCPQCGEPLQSFMASCPACGFELRGSTASSSILELSNKLEKTESASKRSELIRDCYISNTKEDIYEFFILATSNIKAGSPDADAWRAKLEQAYQKAEIVLGDTPELRRIQQLYKSSEDARTVGNVAKSVKTILRSAWAVVKFLLIFGLIFYAILLLPVLF